jgi:hypothetical protein
MPTTRQALSAMGLAVTPPSGWEAAIYRRTPPPGMQTFPVLHLATVALSPTRGDYGSGVVEVLGPQDVFVGILEFGPEAAASALFQGLRAVPLLTPDVYRPYQLQRALPGQGGVQRFFTTVGRAFCLYSVIGAIVNRVPATAKVNQVLASLQVAAAV